MALKFFEEKIPHNGRTFEGYLKELKEKYPDGSPEISENLIKLNYQRMNRISKTYTVSDELRSLLLSKIKSIQIWMIITTDLCGDSAQSIPCIAAIASNNKLINLRIIDRDIYPEVMDHYLTNGTSRSVPILVGFDESGNELFRWGPRPDEASRYFSELKQKGLGKNEINEKMQIWYNNDKGKSIEADLIEIIISLR